MFVHVVDTGQQGSPTPKMFNSNLTREEVMIPKVQRFDRNIATIRPIQNSVMVENSESLPNLKLKANTLPCRAVADAKVVMTLS